MMAMVIDGRRPIWRGLGVDEPPFGRGRALASRGTVLLTGFWSLGPYFVWYIVGMYWGPDWGPILRAHRKTLGLEGEQALVSQENVDSF